jgi:peptidoglycan biosynthesis protein MviN/MurJ (putative lipid II flippase)
MGLRLMWLYVRLGLPQESNETKTKEAAREPATGLWVWAAFSAGLPMVLPFVARTYASNAGEGALATFNYAWKLVELPLVLAIQLVATVTFPVIARGMAPTPPDKEVTQQISQDTGQAIRGAFLLAWTLACAAITALQVGAYLVADLLFGWGRMPAESVTNVAEWGTLGAWSLLPQSLIAVALTVMATLGRMRHIAVAYAAALIVFWVLGTWTNGDGTLIMVSLVAVLSFVACVATYAMHKSCAESSHEVILLPWQSMVTPTAAMLGFVFACQSPWLGVRSFRGLTGYAFCAASALGVFAISYLTNRDLRDLLRR